jgi:hypothetical protein
LAKIHNWKWGQVEVSEKELEELEELNEKFSQKYEFYDNKNFKDVDNQ